MGLRTVGQVAGPPGLPVAPGAHVSDDLVALVTQDPAHGLFARMLDGGWQIVTAKEFHDAVTALARGLVAAGIGVGDRVALMSGTRYEWVLCDFAIWTTGAVTVPVYETSSAAQVAWILQDSGASAAFVEDERYAVLVERAQSPGMRHVWSITGGGLDALAEQGVAVASDELARRRAVVGAESPATIVYTSGTTGRLKGCLLSHANLVAAVHNMMQAEGIRGQVLVPGSSLLLFLPLAHILARVVQLALIHSGVVTAHSSDLRTVTTELRSFRPTLLVAVPRVFEKLYSTAAQQAAAERLGWLFRAAEHVAVDYSQGLDGSGPGFWLRTRHRVFDRLVYARVRAAVGGRVVYAVSGGGPLSSQLGHFVRGAGIPVLEGYGLTETTGPATFNLPAAPRIGTVGRPMPGFAFRIAPDGEVHVMGPAVFTGYWHDSHSSREAFDDDGWLRTGDLGVLADGYLTITGRKKDLIVTSGGKNVAPAALEDRLRTHWLVDECLVVGDKRPYIGALIALDTDAFSEWKKRHHKPAQATPSQLRDDSDLARELQAAIDAVNRSVSHAEAIKRFRILPGPFAVNDELTPTHKVRREHALAKYARDIDALYQH